MSFSTRPTLSWSDCDSEANFQVEEEMASSFGFSSMKEVVTMPASKVGCVSTLSRKGMFVLTPRMRASCSARRMRSKVSSKEAPRAVYLCLQRRTRGGVRGA